MKNTPVRIIISFMIIGLVFSLMAEAALASKPSNCPCCSAVDTCHSNTKCNETAKICVCSPQTIQISMQTNEALPELILSGSLEHNFDFTYIYLSAVEIFHPPKA